MAESDDDYRNRLGLAIYEAVVQASKGEADAALIKSGPAFDALMMVAAMVVAPDPALNTPQAVRLFCENAASVLRKQILTIQSSEEHMAKIDVKPSGPVS